MRPFDRIAVIFNPKSTGDAPALAEQLRAELAARVPGIPVTMAPTEHAGHARDLARELMLRNEARKRYWHVVICDADDHELFDLPFISIDESIKHLNPRSRRLIEVMCERRMALAETLFETRMNVLRARATIARSRARPYIAAELGHAVDEKAKRKA